MGSPSTLHSLFTLTLTLALSRSREREFRLPLLSEETVGARSDATCLVPWLVLMRAGSVCHSERSEESRLSADRGPSLRSG